MSEKEARKRLTGMRWLPTEVAQLVQQTAMGVTQRQICAYDAINHAAATGIAALVVRLLLSELRHFRNQVDVVIGEIAVECDFSLAKLDEHMGLLNELVVALAYVTRQEVFVGVLRALPEGISVHEELVNIQGVIESDVLSHMDRVRFRLREHEDTGSSGKAEVAVARSLQRGRVALQQAKRRIDVLITRVTDMMQNIRDDWTSDLADIGKET